MLADEFDEYEYDEYDVKYWPPLPLVAQELEGLCTQDERRAWVVQMLVRTYLGVALARSEDIDDALREVDYFLFGCELARRTVAAPNNRLHSVYLAAQQEWRRITGVAEVSSWDAVIDDLLTPSWIAVINEITAAQMAAEGIKSLMEMLAEE